MLRASLAEKEFEVIPVESEVARASAEIRSKYRIPMADSVIAASAKLRGLRCVTDDPHISEVVGVETVWL
jgi:predicted nucleic acid-binding protein